MFYYLFDLFVNSFNFLNIFQYITLADDLEFNYSTNSPTMLVEGMIVGGK